MQAQAEVVSKSSNKIHQTWGPPFSRALYMCVVAFFMKIFRAWSELGQWMHKDEVIHDGRCAKLHTKGGLIFVRNTYAAEYLENLMKNKIKLRQADELA